tara:strand:- start:2264 stop:3526 length:1263 start_codon:yes stop_codon:yes gene_type:complete
MKIYSHFDSINKKEYQSRKEYFFEGSSPNLLDKLINYIDSNILEIEAIYIVWYLYNNIKLNNYLSRISKKGVNVVVISIPLEGYDNKNPSNIYNADNTIFKKLVTKHDIASSVYSESSTNFRLYEFPHTFARSKWMKVFSRGDLPYSLHTKSIYIHYKSKKRSLILSSSNFSMRDKVKEENMIIIETESKKEINDFFPIYKFLKDINNYIRLFDFKNINKKFNNKLDITEVKNSDLFYVMAPFYRNSPTIIKNKINNIIMEAKKRVYVMSQHLSGTSDDSITHSILKKGGDGIDICCLTQTSSDKRAGRNIMNSRAFKIFLDSFFLLNSNSKYYVNNNIHSKYIIVDDTLIVTTFNYTPTQFTYIEDVKIPSFESSPNLSYEGIHSEVGHMAVINDPKIVQSYIENFLSLINNESTIQLK